ncbi:MAG: glutathione S-transferase [Burkholderiales bacterium]|nr:glutathione S-transferase [Burkholderiales bacterium]
MQLPLTFKGAPGSPYTRKMLAVLRYRRLPYALLLPNAPQLKDLPTPKVELLPTFYLQGASGTIEAVTDSTPLIRRFEAAFPERHVRPPDPALAFLDSLLEDYADEWLTKAMFHYRWHYADDTVKSAAILPRWRGITVSEARATELGELFAKRQISRLAYVGSSPLTAPVIESSYVRYLAALDAHLNVHPFLLGGRPGAADFAAYGQLTQLALFDPTPAALTLAKAPRVAAWTAIVDDLSGHGANEDQWIMRDAIPPTVIDLLREVGRSYVPVMLANARALKSGAARVECTVEGLPWVQNPFPYQAKCLAWLREEFTALDAAGGAAVRRILAGTGCEALIDAAI